MPARASLFFITLLCATARADGLTEKGRYELDQLMMPPGARDPAPRPPAPPRIDFAEAVRRALAKNPSIAVAQAEIRRAAGLLGQARAASLPTLTANATYVRLDNDRVFGQGDMQRLVAGANQLSGNVTAAVPLIAPRAWAQWLHGHDNLRVSEISAADVRRQVAAATARAYLQVLAQARLVAVSTQARDAARAHHDFAAQRLSGGIGNRLDAVRAHGEWKSSEAQLESAQVALGKSREALGVLIAEDGPVDAAEEPRFDDIEGEGDDGLGSLLEDAMVNRADLRAQQARVWATSRLLRHGFVDYLPTLQGSFAPFFQNPPSLVQPLVGWQAQLGLVFPLFDGGFRYGARAERQALYVMSKWNLRAAQLQARSEVRSAALALTQARLAEQSAHEAAALSREALELSTLAYRTGSTNNLPVIDAERRSRDAALIAVQAEDATRQARFDLLLASGRFPDRQGAP